MLLFPLFGFRPTTQEGCEHKFLRRFRTLLALCLGLFILVAPLGSVVRARGVYQSDPKVPPTQSFVSPMHPQAEVHDHKTSTNVDGFIIEMIDGVSICRGATLDEIPFTLTKPGEGGVPARNLVKADQINPAITSGDNAFDGLTINLMALTQLQNASNKDQVIAAFQRAAAIWTTRIRSPITITMNIEYGPNSASGQPFSSPSTLGSTSSGSIGTDFPTVRGRLLLGSSSQAETNIYNALPQTTIPSDTGNKAAVEVSRSLTQAMGFVGPEPDTVVATISFNSAFQFDFNPDDGIDSGKTDFVAVATHEIGHGLGFTSNNGEGTNSLPTLWDMFRLGPGTKNLTTGQRVMTQGGAQVYFTGQPFTVMGVGTDELGLSTGGPTSDNGGDNRQSSHWKADELTGQYIGIMDPTISSGVVKVPTENDFMALETIGWNLVASTPPPPPPPAPENDNFANAQVISGCSGTVNGTNFNATKESGEPTHVTGAGSRSVWYQWQAPSTGNATLTTIGSGYDTVLAVYTGTSVNALTAIASNDDIGGTPHDVSSTVTFAATAGTIYRIAVDGFNNGGSGGDMGPITLNWTQVNCAQNNAIQFAGAAPIASEGSGTAQIIVNRIDTTVAATVDYATSDTAGLNECNVNNGIASSRCDYATSIGTVRFAVGEGSKIIFIPLVNDSYAEGNETFTITLSNATGSTLGTPSAATFTIQDSEAVNGPNPIDETDFFIRQNYIDFLGREPDPGGLAGWRNVLNNCPASGKDANGNFCDRIEVSAGFFRSEEFQSRGYYIYRFFSALGRIPLSHEFYPDFAKVSGFLTPDQLEAAKAAYVNEVMARADFQTKYSSTFNNPTAYVEALLNTVGLPAHPSRAGWIGTLNASNTTQTRGQVLRQLVESAEVFNKYFNEAFVIMQYFGYLRRTADASYLSWINTMSQTSGDYRIMINGFMNSSEYRRRFGP